MQSYIPPHIRHYLWRQAIKLTEDRFDKYDKICEWETISEKKINRRQNQHLQQTLENAFYNIPYYRRMFHERGLVSDGDIQFNSISDIPILTKSDLQTHFEDLKHQSIESFDWYTNRSGGSTGKPTKFVQCQSYRYWNYGVESRLNEWTGYREGYPRIKLWGSERDVFDVSQSLRSQIGNFLRNETILDAFTISDSDLERYVRSINNSKPIQILTYVDAIHKLATHVKRNDMQIHSPKSIVTSGGTLHQPIRQTVEGVFNTNIFNKYGCREAGTIAFECEAHDGLHIISPTNYVEIVDDKGNPVDEGEQGRVITTTLRNPAMPLIRYEVGDIAVKGGTECSCGRSWPKMENVTGRETDMITTPQGVVSPMSFIHVIGVLFETDIIERYQVIQKSIDHFVVRIVTRQGELNIQSLQDELTTDIEKVVGSECAVEIEVVDKIPPDPSGKHRYIKSEIKKA